MEDGFRSVFDRAKDGDPGAIELLFASHIEGLRAFVRLKSGPVVRQRESCSDLVQTVCRQVLEDLDGVSFNDEAAFKYWLFTIAQNKILNRVRHWRAQKRDAARDLPTGQEDSGQRPDGLLGAYGSFCTPSQDVSIREEIERIERAMDELSEEQRDALIQSKLVGRSYAEIAADTGRTEMAVRKLVSRARARLGILLHRE